MGIQIDVQIEACYQQREAMAGLDDMLTLSGIAGQVASPPELPRRLDSATHRSAPFVTEAPASTEVSPLKRRPIPTVDDGGNPLPDYEIDSAQRNEAARLAKVLHTAPYLKDFGAKLTAKEVEVAEHVLRTKKPNRAPRTFGW